MKRVFILTIILMLTTMNVLSIFSEYTESEEISHIVDADVPKAEHTIVMPDGGGLFTFGNISLRKGVDVYDAYFNLTASANPSDEYPTSVKIEIGDDYMYEFRGQGYGSMGRQDRFNNNNTRDGYSFNSGGSNEALEIKLPKTAQVSSAQMQITGNFFQITDKTRIDTNQNPVSEVHPADMDGDNDTDVVAVGNGEVVWYNNTNNGSIPWSEHKINSSQPGVIAVYVFDVDNDGDMDVAAASRSGNPGIGPIVYYRNMDGKGRSWQTHIVNETGKPFYTCYSIVIADMDNDGDGDIVASSRNGSAPNGAFWFNNTDGNGTVWETRSVGSLSWAQGLTVFDMDGDGDNDTIITSVSPRSVRWFENLDGNATSWSATSYLITNYNSNPWPSPYNLAHTDIDKDGDQDLVVGTSRGAHLLQHPSNPKNTWTRYTVGAFTGWWNVDVAVGDLGNPGDPADGNIDIVATYYNTNDDHVIWFKNDGNPFQNNWESHLISTNQQDPYSVKVAEIDNKSYVDVVVGSNSGSTLDDVVWYRLNGSFPTDVRLDLGKDSVDDWSYFAGYFNESVTTTNLADKFNALITSKPVDATDTYGNEFVTIEFKTTTATAGTVSFNTIDIVYDYTVKVKGSVDRSLAAELNEHLSISGVGNDTFPIKLKSAQGGQLTIKDIMIEYNDFPTALTIPLYGIDEDTRNNSVIDLSNYYTDDYVNSVDLTYEVVSNTNDTIVVVAIDNDHYLDVDAKTGTNNNDWFGFTTVIVKAVDDSGLETESDPFLVEIRPVNDEPVEGTKKFPAIAINEGGKSLGIDLDADDYFVDIDSTDLFFDFEIDPLDEYADEELNAVLDDQTWILEINALGDWYTTPGQALRLRVYCDDDQTDINQSVYQDIFVTVNNLPDDKPVWKDIPDVVINEDDSKTLAFNPISDNYVSDIDNDPEELIFSINSISDTGIEVEIDSQNNVYVTPKPDYFGNVDVEIKASDSINHANKTFKVIVNNVNDKPIAELLSPRDGAVIFNNTVELKWTGTDVDPGDTANLTFKILLDTTGGTTEIEGNYKGTSIIIPDLTDKSTYYWQVVPIDSSGADGTCISVPCPAEFTIDVGVKPHSVLKLPANEAVTNQDFIVLTWDGSGEEGYTISYDVYMSNNSLDSPLMDTDRIAKSIVETELFVENLVPDVTYYWTVIPSTAKGVGSCDSGVWTFMYDPNVTPYKLRIEAPPQIDLEQGKNIQKAITIKNNGANPDIFIPSIDAGTLKFAVELESTGREVKIDKDGSVILIMNITAETLDPGPYDIKITVRSLGSGDEEQATIVLNILEKETESGISLAQVYLAVIPIVIAIIIVLALFLFWRKKRIDEEKKRVETELLRPIPTPTMDASDVQYFGGAAGGAVGAPQLPTVTLPQDYGAGAPGQAGYPHPGGAPMGAPQLPPAQDTTVAAAAAPQQSFDFKPPVGAPVQQPPQKPVPGTAPEAQPPVQPQATVPQQTHIPPQQGRTVNGTGAPPVQVPYIPTRVEKEEAPKDLNIPDDTSAAPSTEQPSEVPDISPAQMLDTLKNKYLQGSVSEETYMSLKKEIRDKMQEGPTAQVDDSIKRFVSGQITEEEFKKSRGA